MNMIGLGYSLTNVGEAETAVRHPGVVFRPAADDTVPFGLAWLPENGNPLLRRCLSLARILARERVQKGSQEPRAP